jgi:acyl-CoA synthetase (AMP-forming)/AMP-acid ligase II
MNTIGTLLHLPIGVGERYLWTLPMFHANGWTYTWTVTAAAAAHVCLRKVGPAEVFRLIREENVTWLCAAPTVLISLASAPPAVRGKVVPGVHVVTAGAPPAAATIERLEGEFGWEVTHVYGLTETAPFITVWLKDVIISGGENISSVEVEGTLLRHPAVQEAAIVGLPHEKWGEAPHAFVVLREAGTATPEELIAFTREHLAHFKAPHGVTFVEELPKTATGKIQKYVLRQGAPNLARQ